MATGTALREIANALDGELAWIPGLGWLRWDGKVWDEVPESTAVTKASRRMDELGHRPSTARELRATLEVDVRTLDDCPYILNVQNGVVNLRTGGMHPHDPSLRLTKVASVDYDPEAQSDAWDEVLAAIPGEARDQLQTHIAWAVAGGPLDRLALIHGPGASGKTTFMQAIRSSLGTYAMATDGELLNLRSPFDVINLRGTRLVVMEDVGPGDMDRVKRLTLMDEFTARRIRQDAITFKRSHSVLLATNLNPAELAGDEGARRRLCPAEFQALRETVPGLHRRVREPEALRAVLRWIVEGAVRGYEAS